LEKGKKKKRKKRRGRSFQKMVLAQFVGMQIARRRVSKRRSGLWRKDGGRGRKKFRWKRKKKKEERGKERKKIRAPPIGGKMSLAGLWIRLLSYFLLGPAVKREGGKREVKGGGEKGFEERGKRKRRKRRGGG